MADLNMLPHPVPRYFFSRSPKRKLE